MSIIQILCKLFSGNMNKNYLSEADQQLQNFNEKNPYPSATQVQEIKKHHHIFSRKTHSKLKV